MGWKNFFPLQGYPVCRVISCEDIKDTGLYSSRSIKITMENRNTKAITITLETEFILAFSKGNQTRTSIQLLLYFTLTDFHSKYGKHKNYAKLPFEIHGIYCSQTSIKGISKI